MYKATSEIIVEVVGGLASERALKMSREGVSVGVAFFAVGLRDRARWNGPRVKKRGKARWFGFREGRALDATVSHPVTVREPIIAVRLPRLMLIVPKRARYSVPPLHSHVDSAYSMSPDDETDVADADSRVDGGGCRKSFRDSGLTTRVSGVGTYVGANMMMSSMLTDALLQPMGM